LKLLLNCCAFWLSLRRLSSPIKSCMKSKLITHGSVPLNVNHYVVCQFHLLVHEGPSHAS
jgi:hypothetical protein